MTYCREEWVLRNVFYSRPLTNCHTVALLAHEDGRDAFVCLQTDNCPVVPCEPYEFATPECMKSINSRPMTARIEEHYSDKFRNLVGEESGAAPAAATPKRLASSRAVLASSKKIRARGHGKMELETSFARSVDALGTARHFVVSVVPGAPSCLRG